MGMGVDDPGHDPLPLEVDDFRSGLRRKILAQLGDLGPDDQDVAVEILPGDGKNMGVFEQEPRFGGRERAGGRQKPGQGENKEFLFHGFLQGLRRDSVFP